MRSARHLSVVLTVGVIALPVPAATARDGQAPAPESRVATSIELALAEYSCRLQTSATTDAAHYECLSARVNSLRVDFGYDLMRLSVTQRKAIDKTCGRLRTAEGRDRYIACVSGELDSLRNKRAPGPAAAPDAASAMPEPAASSVDSPPRSPSPTWTAWLIGFLGAVAVAAGGTFMAKRATAARHRCRSCGTRVPPTADLCPDCRKRAAQAVRQAAERADRERAEEEVERRQEQAKEQQRARDEAEARVRREDEERRQQARREEEARLREEQTRQADVERQRQHDPAAAGDEAFDPYAILGVSRDAGEDAVVEAYQQARSRYDPAAVEYLGDELQRYFKAKADDVERAYRMLAG